MSAEGKGLKKKGYRSVGQSIMLLSLSVSIRSARSSFVSSLENIFIIPPVVKSMSELFSL